MYQIKYSYQSFRYINFLILMNNRLKMLQVDLNSDQSDRQSATQPLHSKPLIFADKFQPLTVTKGMFYSPDEEIDYPIFPSKPNPKQQTSQESQIHSHPKIKMINQIQYDNEDPHPNPLIQINNSHQNQSEIKIEREEEQLPQISLENILFPFNNGKMLQIALSDESSSQTEGMGENGEQAPKIQKKHEHKPGAVQKIDPEKLFQGVEDLNEFSRNFNLVPIQLNKSLQLTVFRNSSGLNSFWPQYKVFVTDSNKHILVAKKMMGSTTSNFYITTEEGVEKVDHLNFIAKMRSNFSGSIYNVFDKGVNPEKQSKFNKTRTIQATIRFNSQTEKMDPRQFQLFMLKPQFSYYDLDGAVPQKEISLDILYEKQGNSQKIYRFKNRKPIYSASLKGFILNFSGRVQMPSIKNFIMEDQSKKQVLMQGKTTDDIFRVDVSSPIPPYIGLCVCLANIDSKFIKD